MKAVLMTNVIVWSLMSTMAHADECKRIINLQKNLNDYSQKLMKLKSPNNKVKNRVAETVMTRNSLNLSVLELFYLAESGSCGTSVAQKGSDTLIIYGNKISEESNIRRDVLKMSNGEFSNSWKRYSENSQETIYKF
jgi:hypothetical protein